MKANELRLGNIVKRGDDVCIVSLCCNSHFNASNLETGIDYGNNHQSNFQPIPLTEEWLVKFGIRQHAMNKFEHIDTGLDMECSYELKYVHQLQNLYFALTGQEL